jgi:hypothetical protein
MRPSQQILPTFEALVHIFIVVVVIVTVTLAVIAFALI